MLEQDAHRAMRGTNCACALQTFVCLPSHKPLQSPFVELFRCRCGHVAPVPGSSADCRMLPRAGSIGAPGSAWRRVDDAALLLRLLHLRVLA